MESNLLTICLYVLVMYLFFANTCKAKCYRFSYSSSEHLSVWGANGSNTMWMGRATNQMCLIGNLKSRVTHMSCQATQSGGDTPPAVAKQKQATVKYLNSKSNHAPCPFLCACVDSLFDIWFVIWRICQLTHSSCDNFLHLKQFPYWSVDGILPLSP